MHIKTRTNPRKARERSVVPPPYDPIKRIKKKRMYRYQRTAHKKVVDALIRFHRALLVMATGLGKTFVSVNVIKSFLKPGEKVLFLCHDTGILDQGYDAYVEFFGKKYSYAKFYGPRKNWEADEHDFVFATFQSIRSHFADADTKNIFSKRHFKYVVVDESHHSKAELFEDVITYFRPQWRLGMTATPDREDEEDITELFGKPVVNYELPEAIAKGWLTPVDYRVLSDGINSERLEQICREVMEGDMRLTEKQLNKQIFIQVRTEEQCRIIKQHTRGGKKAVIFCEDIEHLYHVKSYLTKSGAIHSYKKGFPANNEKTLEDFNNGKINHLLTVDQFNEGRDIPDVEVVVFLRKTDSKRVFTQQLGRGLRLYPGKKKIIVLDFVGNVERISFIQELVDKIEIHRPGAGRKPGVLPKLHVEGKGFEFNFTKNIVDVLKVFQRINIPPYKTWQEASKAAIGLQIKGIADYRAGAYRKDPRLPSDPNAHYPDFPGSEIFFNLLCQTWQEASKIAKKAKLINAQEYRRRAKKVNKRLPSHPHEFYKDFPGWETFLGYKKTGSDKYATWQEASKAALARGIRFLEDYRKKYKKDRRLPANPDRYKNFPGYPKFFGRV